MLEHAAVAFVLLATWATSGFGWLEFAGCAAVQCAFGHAAIADRFAEREALRTVPEVECHRSSLRYFVAKEVLWLAYFVGHKSWSAIVGVGVFLAYPAWRRWYRARFPIGR